MNRQEVRWQQRFENFSRALNELELGCAQESFSNLERSGLIKTFEFTFELAWKTLKDLLFFEGFDYNSPRSVIRGAFEAKYLSESECESFLQALTKRNLLVHVYEEKVALEAQQAIINEYLPLLKGLGRTLSARLENSGER
ncbi:HI0074 family nucleotidyltransferase substrate-binding subunit [Desulfovibrio sp. JC010]|uniref:HI0074 family nucleotidyltransferase substrate-binding subunit n=1 Tax=Desulfovibrio sp. JC010 TaxID=2593641 RepID=UPI0013D743F9|nr:HI0074 family nucleotidyltransferase substrate-binding subunit [Desulfovibrio sp. JC010]NDV28514.1 nucleotidyltransferase [Desulfovibrio sp. JC010]